MRDGETVATTPVGALSRGALVRQMVGREVPEAEGRRSDASGDVLLNVRELSVRAPGGGRFLVQGVSFTVRKGEIVGLAGLQGSGNSEVLQAIFGSQGGRVSGTVMLAGVPAAGSTPAEAIRHRIALLPNDRSRSGLVLERPVRENMTLAALPKFSPGGWVLRAREERTALRRREQLRVRASSVEQEVGTLSGGNQQKVVFAKWLETDPSLLLLDDPTRGVDVGAKAEIHSLIASLRDEGCAILLVSSETPELLALSDRILVMRSGRIVAGFDRKSASQEAVLHAALEPGGENHG